MRKKMIAAIVVLFIAAGAVGAMVFLRRPLTLMPPKTATTEPSPSTTASLQTETIVAEPVPYFPPPSTNLSGGSLGNQRVPGTENIGDITKIYFHQKTQALFMAVVEPNGLRSIWRLTQQGKVERVFVANDLPGEIWVDGDSQGNIYVQHDNPVRLYRSTDALTTWQLVLQDMDGMFWQIADDGDHTLYGTLHSFNTAILYRSTDEGVTWVPWKDFQKLFPEYAVWYDPADPRYKLRHLHGVIYNEKNHLIIVGTGDVARFTFVSADDGATWKKIWDEGYTASTVMSGGNRYLLCPDQLHNHGIALYDIWGKTLKETWSPIPFNYAGYCYSIINDDGIYYAAMHTEANEATEVVPKSGIIVSPDGERWYRFIEWQPLGHHARTNIWLADAPARIYASVNGALYAFSPLTHDWFKDKTPF